MKKLSRNWRKSIDDKSSLPISDDPTSDDSRPMDTEEQEELIRSLERTQAQQSLVWRRLFAAFIFCYAAFEFYSIYHQATSPWELKVPASKVYWCRSHLQANSHKLSRNLSNKIVVEQLCLLPSDLQRFHAYFMEDLDSWMVIFADWLAILASSMAILGLLHNSKHHRQWIWRSCYVGFLLAGFWLYFILRLPKFRWDILWLPFGPLSGASLCLYVDRLLSESSEEVKKLRGYMYAFKAS